MMLFNLALSSSLLSAPAVLGVPSGLGTHVARRQESHLCPVKNCLELPPGPLTEYDTISAGAIWRQAGTFNSITGTFIVPAPSGSTGDAAAAWVGIYEVGFPGLFQTGIDFVVGSGQHTYTAWYGWYPDTAIDFSGISISAGDTIRLTIIVSTTTSGTAKIENLSNGQVVSESLTSSTSLCGQSAEWIVEDYVIVTSSGNSTVALANFGTVKFTNAEATGAGTYYYPSGATMLDISQNNVILTSVSISGSSVTIQYV